MTSVSKDFLVIVSENTTKAGDQLNEIKTEIFSGNPFTYVSLFSGIGGFEQALNPLGGTCVLASEIDKFANQSYKALYGHETAGDITKIEAEDVPDHDLLVGGFPCQAFSVAGKRLGFDDTRGTLFFEIARIAKVKRPKALLLENVKGLVGHDKGKTLDSIVQTLNEIGYTVDFEVMNSKYFGVPQNRERIFIIAVRGDLIEQQPWVIGKRTDVVAKGKKRISQLEGVKTFNFDWPEQEAVTTKLRDILESEVDEKYYLSEEKTAKLVAKLDGKTSGGKDGIEWHGSLKTQEKGTPRDYIDVYGVMGGGGVSQCLRTMQGGNREPKIAEPRMIGHVETSGNDICKRVYAAEGISPTVPTGVSGGTTPKVAELQQFSDRSGISRCLAANYTKGTAPGDVGKGRRTHIIENEPPRYRIRKLTPLECWRLQGFSDEAHNEVKAAGISDSQRYKQAGNAVTVNVISALGKRLITILN